MRARESNLVYREIALMRDRRVRVRRSLLLAAFSGLFRFRFSFFLDFCQCDEQWMNLGEKLPDLV